MCIVTWTISVDSFERTKTALTLGYNLSHGPRRPRKNNNDTPQHEIILRIAQNEQSKYLSANGPPYGAVRLSSTLMRPLRSARTAKNVAMFTINTAA